MWTKVTLFDANDYLFSFLSPFRQKLIEFLLLIDKKLENRNLILNQIPIKAFVSLISL